MKKIILFLGLFSFILVYFFFENIKASEVKDMIGSLQAMSAAVLTVSGLWLAILYPEAVRDLAKDSINKKEGEYNVKVVEKLVVCIVSSALIITVVVLMNLVNGLYSPGFNPALESYINFSGMWMLVFAIMLQLLTFYVVITLCLDFASKLHDILENQKSEDDLL